MTDEETFARVFGRTDWAVMFILARQGQSYARLRFHVGPGGDWICRSAWITPARLPPATMRPGRRNTWRCVETADPLLPGRSAIRRLPAGAVSLLEPWDDDWFLGWEASC